MTIEFRALEHAEMLHDRAAVEIREVRAQIAGRPRRLAEQVQDAPSRRVAERPEDAVLLVDPA